MMQLFDFRQTYYLARWIWLSLMLFFSYNGPAQTYTSYFTGSSDDVSPTPLGGVCLMGGASENDEAMRWFLERSSGGDVLVLRASGADGYNSYLFEELGVVVNSVETIVFHESGAAYEPYVHERIRQAEAIWLAGGDQYDYVKYWRNTPVDSLINAGKNNRNLVIGGTSAGMAVLGEYYFSAKNGTITSSAALANPYDSRLSIDSTAFFELPYLRKTITDTHYDNPDRRGRHITFLARMMKDWKVRARGIACEEYTAVCIDEQGKARVFGDYPEYDDAAYFIIPNCAFENPQPEVCRINTPLTWDLQQAAVTVYKVNGVPQGTNSFDLNDWMSGEGGNWMLWYVNEGNLQQAALEENSCELITSVKHEKQDELMLYPIPVQNNTLYLKTDQLIRRLELIDVAGRIHPLSFSPSAHGYEVDITDISAGAYSLSVNGLKYLSLVVQP